MRFPSGNSSEDSSIKFFIVVADFVRAICLFSPILANIVVGSQIYRRPRATLSPMGSTFDVEHISRAMNCARTLDKSGPYIYVSNDELVNW